MYRLGFPFGFRCCFGFGFGLGLVWVAMLCFGLDSLGCWEVFSESLSVGCSFQSWSSIPELLCPNPPDTSEPPTSKTRQIINKMQSLKKGDIIEMHRSLMQSINANPIASN